MPTMLRWTVWTVLGALWLSGCVWLVLHFGCEQPSEFGPLPDPWEATVLHAHGWLAVAGVFLLGWIAGSHVLDRWLAPRKRFSGLALAGGAAVLTLSGYALYYTTDALHSAVALAHQVLGAAAIALALLHWRGRAGARGRRFGGKRARLTEPARGPGPQGPERPSR